MRRVLALVAGMTALAACVDLIGPLSVGHGGDGMGGIGTGSGGGATSSSGGGAGACEPGAPDSDGDGVADDCDKCPGHPDPMDADMDGVPDGCDVCAGFDDHLDSDGDGVPDGCDGCPGHDDHVDTDGDGVADGCDVCPGHDDHVDSDGDGLPDGCDLCPYDGPTAQPLQNNATVSLSSMGMKASLKLTLTKLGGISKNVIVVSPGAIVHADWVVSAEDCICTSCDSQAQLGFAGGPPLVCDDLGTPGCLLSTTQSAGDLTAPSAPGVYEIRVDRGVASSCDPAPTQWGSMTAPGPDNTVGVVCVQ